MDVESSICLSDLVPALRWSRPQQVAEALSDPRLPSAWWSSMALPRALSATGLDWMCERLALLASSRWDHLPLGDVLPALAVHPMDVTLPGCPEPARTAIIGLGGWHRLRRLSPADLKTPGSSPETVMGSVFHLVLGRLVSARPDTAPGHPEVTRPVQRGVPGTGSFPERGAAGTGSFPAVAESGNGSFTPPARPGTGSFPAVGGRPAAASEGARPVAGQNGAGPAKNEPLPQRRDTGTFPRVGDGPRPGGDTRRPAASFPPENGRSTGSFPAVGEGGRSTGSFPAVGEGGRSTGAFPAVGGSNPLPQRPAAAADSPGPHTGSLPAYPGGPAQRTPAPSDTDHAMVRVVDSLFRGLNKLELAVAEHRLFAEDPISLRTLAHKMLVEREILSHAQRTAEERVLTWLRSSESAPITGHMFRLTEWLGAAATEEQLIGADPAHPAIVPSLRTPLWRVLVTLMPDRRLQDGWLVVGDLHGLQSRTRRLLASAQPDADLVELMAELGIRAHSAKAWLEALPPERAHDPVAAASDAPPQPLPRRTPGANGHHHRGGQPIPAAQAGSIDPSAALATLSALSNGRSPMLQGHLAGTPATPPPPPPSPSSDPRRWQRIEVKPEHLRGGPVPVPQNYAAQLGMRPGTLLSVTGPGDNAIVLVWQGQQPVFDSLQPVLMRLNARPGDQVYVTVDGYRLEAQLTG
ncbi:hypothetical protein [Nonomuraea sp. NPDC048826]|uniref:hypothetical protein n=1 Tax=Nonomuraea sp. NPDC048826 TaxID=3364347 RepID=UPI00371F4D70